MLALLSFISLAFAKEIPIASIEASSYRAPDSSTKYDPKQLFDGKSVTAWIEDDEGSGLGSWFEVSFAEETTVTSMKMWNGYWYSFNEWDFHNRVAKMEVTFEDGSKEVFDLDDKKKVETIEFAKPHTGKSFKVRFAKVHSGSAYAERTAVSEVKVYDSAPEDFHVATIKASSTLPEDNDGSYYPANLQDNLKDTPWCEGSKGLGVGETLTYTFDSAKEISKVDVVNGNGTDFKLFMAYGSVKTLKLTFDNGKSQNLVLKPSLMPQTLNIEPVTAKSVTVELVDVKEGKTVQDTCLSEVRFK
jgi:hypothetical protein